MAATTTLGLTTLAETVDDHSSRIKVASTSGLIPGMFLWFDKELCKVVSLDAVSPWVNVLRGVGFSSAGRHASGAQVLFGKGDQFFDVDPVGTPPASALVVPYVNVRTGDIFFPQGDVLPDGNSNRWWQKVTLSYVIGPLGIRQPVYDPPDPT